MLTVVVLALLALSLWFTAMVVGGASFALVAYRTFAYPVNRGCVVFSLVTVSVGGIGGFGLIRIAPGRRRSAP